jgi:D-alanyl-D-alanine carboxypeptidase/D-alanyl-D-alanine-endopeptidase (penicillin-binding protein 4)
VARRDSHHGSRLAFWLPVVLVLAVLVAGGVAYRLDPDQPDPTDDPAAVAPPAGLALPALSTPAPVAEPAQGALDPAKVRRAVAPLLADGDLGPEVLATVAGLDGTLLFSTGMGTATPASTLKLLTTTSALETLGPDHTFATTVVSDAPGRIVLVGGGDPLLSSRPGGRATYPHPADVVTLAKATAQALQASGRTRVRVGYDTSLFSGPAVNPHWPATYIPEAVVSPISPLWVDEGRPATGSGRVDDPAATAATAFAAALDKAGVEVVGAPQQREAEPGAAELARVTSPPLSQIVEHTLEYSDNEAAEVLLRQVGLATGDQGSSRAGVTGVLETLGTLGVPTDGATLYDGSGLSRDDLVDPDTLAAVLEVAGAADHPELRAVLSGLPVAGFNGSLADRFEDEKQGRGIVRAKTGTLSGVSGLAGTVTDRDGRPMVFALLADRVSLVDTLGARDALDAVASALAACRCGG